MLISALLALMVYMFIIVMEILATIFVAFTLPVQGIGSYLGYVFGNIMLLNGILPISETLVLASAALTLKVAILIYKGFLFALNVATYVRRTFFTIRI